MKEIPVKKHGAVVMCSVDDEDFVILGRFKWSTAGAGYPVKSFWKKKVYMHHAILWCPKGMEIDHIDGNILNNQKSNLRVCTRSQNNANMRKPRTNTSGVKGVYWSNGAKRWVAQISISNVGKYLGSFTRKEDAAAAYRKAALERSGDFAKF